MIKKPKMKEEYLLIVTPILILIFLLILNKPAFSRRMSYRYFPADQEVDSVETLSATEMTAFEIAGCSAEISAANICNDCLRVNKECPNCCLTATASTKVKKCTKDDDLKYDCPDTLFDSIACTPIANCTASSCTALNVTCLSPFCFTASAFTVDRSQKEGCPDPTPFTKTGNCTGTGPQWRCDVPDALPTSQGCPPSSSTASLYTTLSSAYSIYKKLSTTNDFYDIWPFKGATAYTANNNFTSYINSCNSAVNQYETCRDDIDCCEKTDCLNCNSKNQIDRSGCPSSSCDSRINAFTTGNVSCYKTNDCSKELSDSENCFSGEELTTTDYFQDIDTSFSYPFVYRSNQDLTIMWQIISDQASSDTSGIVANKDDAFFYTRAVIIDKAETNTAQNKIFESFSHKKGLNADFSIFGLTHIHHDYLDVLTASNSSTYTAQLKPGNPYEIKVYYYLPDYDNSLSTASTANTNLVIKNMRINVIKTKE